MIFDNKFCSLSFSTFLLVDQEDFMKKSMELDLSSYLLYAPFTYFSIM